MKLRNDLRAAAELSALVMLCAVGAFAQFAGDPFSAAGTTSTNIMSGPFAKGVGALAMGLGCLSMGFGGTHEGQHHLLKKVVSVGGAVASPTLVNWASTAI